MQRIVPAILTQDSEELRKTLTLLKDHTKWVHIDVADGKFVQNTTVSLHELGEAYQFFNLEIHLMVQDPSKYFSDCEGIGAKRVIFHYEATGSMDDTFKMSEKHEFQKGLAVNPETQLEAVQPYFEKVDSLLLMSIHPGFQGQEFILDSLEKINEKLNNLDGRIKFLLNKRKKINAIMEILTSMQSQGDISMEDIRASAEEQGIENIDEVIEKLKQQGTIFEPKPGFIRKV